MNGKTLFDIPPTAIIETKDIPADAAPFQSHDEGGMMSGRTGKDGTVYIESYTPSLSHSGSSQEGAEKVDPTQGAVVLNFLKRFGGRGATDEEIAAHYPDIRESDLRRARIELTRIGLVSLKRLPDAHDPCPMAAKNKRRGYCSECVMMSMSTHGVRVAVWYAVEFSGKP